MCTDFHCASPSPTRATPWRVDLSRVRTPPELHRQHSRCRTPSSPCRSAYSREISATPSFFVARPSVAAACPHVIMITHAYARTHAHP